jgi:hypothetical protein
MCSCGHSVRLPFFVRERAAVRLPALPFCVHVHVAAHTHTNFIDKLNRGRQSASHLPSCVHVCAVVRLLYFGCMRAAGRLS